MEEKKKNKKTVILVVIIVLESIILLISLAYSSLIFIANDEKTEWFNEISPDGNYHVKCFKVGTPMFFSSQELLIYFSSTSISYVGNTNSISFRTDLANDGAKLDEDNYEIEWLEDSVKIIFRGKETGGDNIFIIPYSV